YTVAPPIRRPSQYGIAWYTWWRTLQPGWRLEGVADGSMVQHGEAGNEDWLKVAKGVLNGFVLVLISLSWW
ncbi:hypothetical protein FIBSPDRAFT_661231, partial [Athelia psychrophila]